MTTVSKNEDIFISKATINRLMKDVRYLLKNPLIDQGIIYKHDEKDILKGYALIFGPEETVYQHGAYLFELTFPSNYPHSPPLVKYHTNDGHTRFNPNLYRNGKVCISILNTWKGEQWTSCQTINSVLLTICSILNNEPLLNEPGITKQHKDFNSYNEIIKYKNFEVAILKMVMKDKGIYPTRFDSFYLDIKNNFITNYEKILATLEKNKKLKKNIKTSLYSMDITIDYNSLIAKIKDAKDYVNK